MNDVLRVKVKGLVSTCSQDLANEIYSVAEDFAIACMQEKFPAQARTIVLGWTKSLTDETIKLSLETGADASDFGEYEELIRGAISSLLKPFRKGQIHEDLDFQWTDSYEEMVSTQMEFARDQWLLLAAAKSAVDTHCSALHEHQPLGRPEKWIPNTDAVDILMSRFNYGNRNTAQSTLTRAKNKGRVIGRIEDGRHEVEMGSLVIYMEEVEQNKKTQGNRGDSDYNIA